MQLTVLGTAGSHTGPGRACSGYLLRHDGTTVLVDVGNGSTAELQRHIGFEDVDAVLVSHRHVDHCVDLVGMFYALRFHDGGPRRVDLYAPDGVVETLTGLLSDDSRMAFDTVFRTHRVAAGDTLDLGPLEVELHHSVHPPPTVSMRFHDGERVLTYSADSAGGPDLVAAARGADVFLCEATWQGDPSAWPDGVHLTARGAGEVAEQAGVGRLLLTHVLGSADRDVSLSQARETFSGDLELAEDGETYEV
jgi:ribonuclease BN (tRNA processing enzyme)